MKEIWTLFHTLPLHLWKTMKNPVNLHLGKSQLTKDLSTSVRDISMT